MQFGVHEPGEVMHFTRAILGLTLSPFLLGGSTSSI